MRSILKYPGSKWRIANWIIEKMPEHHSYLEPYFGSGAVFFNKAPSNIETINDIDSDITNLFNVIRENTDELLRKVVMTPYSRKEYDNAFIATTEDDNIESARKFLIRCWQGIGSNNKYKSGWKNDVQGRERAYAVKNWYELPEKITEIVDRLKTVQIENRPAVELIKRFNSEKVLIYADPPYLTSTRKRNIYKYEMTDQEHEELLKVLLKHKGPVIISGYDNEMYNEYLKTWEKYQINNLAEHGIKRVETLWIKGAEIL